MSARIRKHIAVESGSNEYRSSGGRNGWTPGAQSPGAQPTSSARSSDVGNSAHREREPVERGPGYGIPDMACETSERPRTGRVLALRTGRPAAQRTLALHHSPGCAG